MKSRIAKPDGHVLHSNEFAEYEKIIIKKMIKFRQPKGFFFQQILPLCES